MSEKYEIIVKVTVTGERIDRSLTERAASYHAQGLALAMWLPDTNRDVDTEVSVVQS